MKKVFIALSVLAVFASCKKNDNNTSTAITVQNLAGSYKVVSIKMKAGTMPEQDVTNQYLDACELDDLSTLNANGSFVYTDAGVKCNPDGSHTGNWSLSGNQITIDGEESTITSFSGGNLVTTQSATVNNVTYSITTTVKKQ